MNIHEFEARVAGWAESSICGAYPPKSWQRVVAEAALIIRMRQVEHMLESLSPVLQQSGVVSGDGKDIDLRALRDVLVPALEKAGGLEMAALGKVFKIGKEDVEELLNAPEN